MLLQADAKLPKLLIAQALPFMQTSSNSVLWPFEACGSMVGPWGSLDHNLDTARGLDKNNF